MPPDTQFYPDIVKKKPLPSLELLLKGVFKNNPGDDLLSHPVAQAVPSALEGLTAVFGMGTGVTPPVLSPRKLFDDKIKIN